jgi:hypothetical protein
LPAIAKLRQWAVIFLVETLRQKDGHTVAMLKIEWKDSPGETGGTMLTIEVDGDQVLDKHYSRRRIKEARKAARKAVKDAEDKFDNKKENGPSV